MMQDFQDFQNFQDDVFRSGTVFLCPCQGSSRYSGFAEDVYLTSAVILEIL